MASNKLIAPELVQIQIGGMNRQTFLLRTTLAAGATMGAALATPHISRAVAQESGGDIDILNFALALEYLETKYYDEALKNVSGLGKLEDLATEIRDNEQEHVDALKATIEQLGGTPDPEPTFNFGSAFESVESFLKLANTLEDTGVSAYNGAAVSITSKDVLGAAGGIVQNEARHAALIRLERGVPPAPLSFDKASEKDEVLDAVTPLIEA